MNIVDALVVTLGLDASAFVKGQKDASASFRKTKDEAKRQGKDVEESSKKMLDGISKLKVEVLGLFAAFTAGQGIKAFTEAVTAANVAIGRMASNLSSSPETLAAWQGAAERMGGSAEATTNSLQGLSDKLMELHQNGAANQTLLRIQALGQGAGAGAIDFNHGGIQTALTLADSLHAIQQKYGTAQADWWGRQLGIDDSTVHLLMQGRSELEKLLAVEKKYAPKDADVAASQRLMSVWIELKQASTALGRSILTALSPALEVVGKGLVALANWALKHKPFLIGTFTALTVAVAGMAAALAAPYAGFIALVAAVGAISTAIGLLVQAVVSLWPQIVKGWNNMLSTLGDPKAIMRAFHSAFDTALAWIKGELNSVAEFLFGRKFFDDAPTTSGGEGGAGAEGGSSGGASGGSTGRGRGRHLMMRGDTADNSGRSRRPSGRTGNYEESWKFWKSKGVSDQYAAAMVAMEAAESAGNPSAKGDYNRFGQPTALGLFQHHADRRRDIAAGTGIQMGVDSHARQLEGAWWELTHGHDPQAREAHRRMMAAKTAAEATAAAVDLYERPGDKPGQIRARTPTANFYYNSHRQGSTASSIRRAITPIPHAASFRPTGPTPMLHSDNSRTMHVTNDHDVAIHKIEVHTQATDGHGVAHDLRHALKSRGIWDQANYGLR